MRSVRLSVIFTVLIIEKISAVCRSSVAWSSMIPLPTRALLKRRPCWLNTSPNFRALLVVLASGYRRNREVISVEQTVWSACQRSMRSAGNWQASVTCSTMVWRLATGPSRNQSSVLMKLEKLQLSCHRTGSTQRTDCLLAGSPCLKADNKGDFSVPFVACRHSKIASSSQYASLWPRVNMNNRIRVTVPARACILSSGRFALTRLKTTVISIGSNV